MNLLQRFFLFVSIFGISGILFFEQALGARLLESGFFENTISRPQAEDFVSDRFDGVAQYSWYGSRGFRPAIYVMLEKDGIQRKVVLNALSGDVIDAHFDSTKEETFAEFKAKEMALDAEIAAEKERQEMLFQQEQDQIAAEKIAEEEAQKKAEELAAQETAAAETERIASEKAVQEAATKLAVEKMNQNAVEQETAKIAAEKAAQQKAITDAAAAKIAAEKKAAADEAARIAVEKAAQQKAIADAEQQKQQRVRTKAS